MLIDDIETVETIKISASFSPDKFPHYRLLPINTEAGKKYCLFFYVSMNSYLMIQTGIQHYKAIQQLKRLLQTAPYDVYEVDY